MAKIAHSDFLNTITASKTDDFTADGESGTVYIVSGQSADVEISLEDSAAETRFTFVNSDESFDLRILPATGETIKFWSEAGSEVDTVTDNGEYLQVRPGASVTLIKASATNWALMSGFGFQYND